MSLEAELALFEENRLEWLKEYEGQFALIKGTDVSFHANDNDAYTTGIDKWGDEPMLIKQVLREDVNEDSLTLLYGLLNAAN